MLMLIKRNPLRVGLAGIAFCVLIMIFILTFFQARGISPALALEKTGITNSDLTRVPLYKGDPWKPSAGADGFAQALENESFAFYIQPGNTQIALLDKRTGYRWSSNPSD